MDDTVRRLALRLKMHNVSGNVVHHAAILKRILDHKGIKTQMVKAACEKGGQDEAKKQMIAFVSKNAEKGQKLTNTKFFTCNACHQNLEPNYDRKAEAYDLYTKLGGK